MIKLFDSEIEMLKLLGSNRILPIRVNKQAFCLIRSDSGYFMTEALCPHMDYPLSDAKLTAQNEIVCMWHAYRFNLETGEECQRRCRKLKSFPIKLNENGACYVVLD